MLSRHLLLGPSTRFFHFSHPITQKQRTETTFFSLAAADVDPVQNTDATAGAPESAMSFPFVTTEQDVQRVRSYSIAD